VSQSIDPSSCRPPKGSKRREQVDQHYEAEQRARQVLKAKFDTLGVSLQQQAEANVMDIQKLMAPVVKDPALMSIDDVQRLQHVLRTPPPPPPSSASVPMDTSEKEEEKKENVDDTRVSAATIARDTKGEWEATQQSRFLQLLSEYRQVGMFESIDSLQQKTKRLLDKDPAALKELMSAEIPELTLAQVDRQKVLAGKFRNAVTGQIVGPWPECKRGNDCKAGYDIVCDRVQGDPQLPARRVGGAILTIAELERLERGLDVRVSRLCHFCNSQVVSALRHTMTGPLVLPDPELLASIQALLHVPYTVPVNVPGGFAEHAVYMPQSHPLIGQRTAAKTGETEESLKLMMAKHGNARLPSARNADFAFPPGPVPRFHVATLSYAWNGETEQWRIRMNDSYAYVPPPPPPLSAAQRLDHAWQSQQTVHRPMLYLMRCTLLMNKRLTDPAARLLLPDPQGMSLHELENDQEGKSRRPRLREWNAMVLDDVKRGPGIFERYLPIETLSELWQTTRLTTRLRYRRFRTLPPERAQGLMRWSVLVHLVRSLPVDFLTYDELEAILYVLDAQWHDVLWCIEVVLGLRDEEEEEEETKRVNAYMSNGVLHFSSLPYAGDLLPDAMMRHGEADSHLAYLFEKAQLRQSMMRSMKFKGLQAMQGSPFTCRYIRELVAGCMLFGVCSTAPDVEVRTLPKRKEPKRKMAWTTSSSSSSSDKSFGTRAINKRLPLRHRADANAACLQTDIVTRGIVYRWFTKPSYRYRSVADYEQTEIDKTLHENQFLIIYAVRALMVWMARCHEHEFREQLTQALDSWSSLQTGVVHSVEHAQSWMALVWRCMDLEKKKVSPLVHDWLVEYAQTHGFASVPLSTDYAATVQMILAEQFSLMGAEVRTHTRLRYPTNSVVEVLRDRFAVGQKPKRKGDDKEETHQQLGVDKHAFDILCQRFGPQASALLDHDVFLFKVLHDDLKCPVSDLVKLWTLCRTVYSVIEMERAVQAYATECPATYMLARAATLLALRCQSQACIALPAYVARCQLEAARQRVQKLGLDVDESHLITDTMIVWYCPVCLTIGNFVRSSLPDGQEADLAHAQMTSDDLDRIHEHGESTNVYRRIYTVLKKIDRDQGLANVNIDLPTGKRYCMNDKTFNGQRCRDTELIPLSLIGRAMTCNGLSSGMVTTICPQKECGVPANVSLRTGWNERGPSCALCLVHRVEATKKEKEEKKKKENKSNESCGICRRPLEAGVEWDEYGLLICAKHRKGDLDQVKMHIDPSLMGNPTVEALQDAYSAWRKEATQGRSTRYLVSKLETKKPRGGGKSKTRKTAVQLIEEEEMNG
jgi:hypothetical protein